MPITDTVKSCRLASPTAIPAVGGLQSVVDTDPRVAMSLHWAGVVFTLRSSGQHYLVPFAHVAAVELADGPAEKKGGGK